MAKINNNNIQGVRDGFNRYFPEDIPPASFKDGPFSSGDFSWENRQKFIEFVGEEVKVYIDINRPDYYKLVKTAEQAFEAEAVSPEKPVERTTPEDLKHLEEVAAAEKEKYQKSIDDAKKNVEDTIKRQQEMYEKLAAQQKTIYAKVDPPKSPTIPVDKQKEIQVLVEAARTDPQQLTRDIAEKVRAQIEPNLKNQLSEEEISFIAQKTAYDTVSGLANPESQVAANIQTAILDRISTDQAVVPKIVGANSIESLRQAAAEVGFFKDSAQLSRSLIATIDGDLAWVAFGASPKDYKVNFYDKAVPGYTNTVSPDQLTSGHVNLLHNQSAVFDNVRDFAQGEARGFVMQQARTWIEGQVTRMSPEVLGVYQNAFVQDALRAIGLAKPVAFGETGFGGLVLKIPGASSFFEGLGKATGVNFVGGAGKAAAKALTTEAVTTVGTEALTTGIGVAAAETGGGAAGAAAGAAAGSVVPVVGTIVGAIIGFVVSLVGSAAISWISKQAQKNKEMFVAVPVAILVTLFAGPLAGIFAGAGAFGLMSFTGGAGPAAALNSTVSGVLSVFSAAFATFLAAIAAPVFAFIIGFPILVVFILVIINAGAYVVPPGELALSSTNPYISVVKTANPSGQLASPQTITYTVTITAKKDPLTGITFTYDCTAVKKSGPSIDCKGLEKIPAAPAAINPGTPFTFTFTSNYDSKYQDSLVSDNITVSAVSTTGGKVSATGSASICFGQCPLDCFAFPAQYWPNSPDVQNLKSLLTGAASTLAGKYQNFATKVCKAGTVNLCYNPGKLAPGIFGYHEHGGACDIDFNTRVVPYGPEGALFLLTHEATHHIQEIPGGGGLVQQFEDQVSPSEPSVCTYGGTNSYESMAEGDALFVAKPIIDANGACLTNYQTQYPKHYNFAKTVMFGQ